MKRFNKVLTSIIAFVMLFTMCFSLTGCIEDIKKVELTIAVYDYENNQMYEESDVTLTLELYRHLAPNTVDAIMGYIEDGYYDNAVFYKMEGRDSQLMVGDLKLNGSVIEQNAIKPAIDGEFEKGGTTGSNLTNKKGAVGLWRTWNAYDGSYTTSTSTDTGRATWFMPTETISSYDTWFCVFAQIDMNDTSNSNAITAIINAFGSDGNYEEYEIYYTGEYDAEKVDENHGLKFNIVPEDEFDENAIPDLFEAEGAEYVCYNHYTVKIPVTEAGGTVAAKIVSAKLV